MRTLFEGVFQVPPGHYLIATEKHIAAQPVIGISTTQEPIAVAHAVRRLTTSRNSGHALEEAVRIRLRADVPVGCYLSGGLDSCAVLGLAAKHRSDPIRAFTLELRSRRI